MRTEAQLRVHDLLRVMDAGAIRFDDPPPPWAQRRVTQAPWVVARRAPARQGWLAAGLRGQLRSERCAIWIAESAIEKVISPEDLVFCGAWNRHIRSTDLPVPAAIAALPAVAAVLNGHLPAAAWGPTGSVGLQLADREPWVMASSDLDIMMRSPAPLAKALARTLHRSLSRLEARVDLLIETPFGGIALADWAFTDGPCLLRTDLGPRLVIDPWAAAIGV